MIENVSGAWEYTYKAITGILLVGAIFCALLGLFTAVVLLTNFKKQGTFVLAPTHIYIGKADSIAGVDY